jgi:hypothetical protein
MAKDNTSGTPKTGDPSKTGKPNQDHVVRPTNTPDKPGRGGN